MTVYSVDFSTENSNIVEVERVCVLLLPIWENLSSTVMYWNPVAMVWTEYVQAMQCSHDKLGCNSSMSLMYVLFHSAVLWNLSSVKFSFEYHLIGTKLRETRLPFSLPLTCRQVQAAAVFSLRFQVQRVSVWAPNVCKSVTLDNPRWACLHANVLSAGISGHLQSHLPFGYLFSRFSRWLWKIPRLKTREEKSFAKFKHANLISI